MTVGQCHAMHELNIFITQQLNIRTNKIVLSAGTLSRALSQSNTEHCMHMYVINATRRCLLGLVGGGLA